MSDLRLLGFSRPLPLSLLLHVFSPTTSHDEQPNDAANRWPAYCLALLYENTSIASHVSGVGQNQPLGVESKPANLRAR